MTGVILALGSINADFQVRLERPFGDADMAKALGLARFGGGKAANVAYCARRLGHDAWLFGRVGDDDLAAQALDPLRAAGVDLSGVTPVAGSQTGFALVLVPPSGRKRIVSSPNANDVWDDGAVAVLCRRIGEAPPGSVLVADCEVPATVVRQALAAAKRRGLRTLLDPSFPERVDDALLATVDAVTPNESEARALLGAGDDEAAEDLARQLARRRPGAACVKRAGGGCVLLEAGRMLRIDAVEVEVVDSTGAGDAFAGAFAATWVEGRTTADAARAGVAASTCAVNVFGAQPSCPDRAALDAMLHRQESASPR